MCPILIAMLFGVVAHGIISSTISGLQQLTAESARSAVGGLSDAERSALAKPYVTLMAASYPSVDAGKLTVSTDAPIPDTFRVLARYDMSSSFVYRALKGVPLPDPMVTRAAVIQRGGL